MKIIKNEIIKLFEAGFSPLTQRLFRDKTDQLAEALHKRDDVKKAFSDESGTGRFLTLIIDSIVLQTGVALESIKRLRLEQVDFSAGFASANTENEKKEMILRFASVLGASPAQIRRDRRALSRWFGYDAVLERCHRKISETEYHLVFLLNGLGGISSGALKNAVKDTEQERILNHVNLEKTLKPLLAYNGDERVRIETFRCMAGIIRSLPPHIKAEKMEESVITFIYRASLDVRQQIWIQNEALALLSLLDPDSFLQAATKRLFNPSHGDDFFVRRKAVKLLCDHIYSEREIKKFIPTISRDISPFVRQAVPRILIKFLIKQKSEEKNQDIIAWLRHILLKDKSPQVRAAVLLEVASSMTLILPYLNTVSDLFADHFSMETSSFVLRVGFKSVCDVAALLKRIHHHNEAGVFLQRQLPLITGLHQNADSISVRRWAASARERLLIQNDEYAHALMEKLKRIIPDIRPGQSKRIPDSWFAGVGDEKTGRILSVLAQENFSLGLKKGIFKTLLFRGDCFSFRLWRFLHEFFSSSPDKRQGFNHLTGRKFFSHLRAPSSIGSELTQTKVPGEPLYFDTEAGWRPYLPLVDEFVSCANQFFFRRDVQIYTPEGVTRISPPRSFFRSLYALTALTFRFKRYAKLRNWHENSQSKPHTYINALRKLGFGIRFSGFKGIKKEKDEDPSVARFFVFLFPLITPEPWEQIKRYFFSAYENTLYELGLFAGFLLLIFLYKHFYRSRAVLNARKKIKLVIGGWGTRGKSGVERLKAAIFEALGHGFVNKTTGCEAMFLHAFPFGKTREMFLFRPYDKATIWEHHHLICMTRKLKSNIFLWECMGLTPPFVAILQKHWTRDDISTITNTYPDHEDIQGPAGINIPEVMTNFIPEKSVLITSEEEMTPILAESAKQKETTIEYTGWLEAGLLTPDVLERFPYEEHPSNVALVLKLAQLFEIDSDFALREMADRVVPDIGALKIFPIAPVKKRRLEFINGMSANERFATISNWRRTGFDTHDYEKEPEIILSTLVNNRADRIPRSRMFAEMIVNDLNADYHFLIGSNLSGLSGFIDAAWSEFIARNSLYSGEDATAEAACNTFSEIAVKLRITISRQMLFRRLEFMLKGIEMDCTLKEIETPLMEYLQFYENPSDASPLDHSKLTGLDKIFKAKGGEKEAEGIIRHIKKWSEELHDYHVFQEKINTRQKSKKLENEFKHLITGWFKKKLIVIDNQYATGNQIIHTIWTCTPPGLLNRIMGLQNIKGPGLDYVYRWQAWEKCYLTGQKLLNDRAPEVFEEGFQELTAFQEYGILCEDYVMDILSETTAKVIAQTEKYQAGFSLVRSNLDNAMNEIRGTLKSIVPGNNFKKRVMGFFESLLDAGDAVKRRKIANRIYEDLINQRISHDRAAIELKKLNQRQKGGWLGD